MLKFEIKKNENVIKIKLNKRFSKTIQIADDLHGIEINAILLLYYVGLVIQELEIKKETKLKQN